MKRTTVSVLMIALALVALAASTAFAQAPAPKVTINGLIDNVTSYTSNISNNDGGLINARDKQWYARTRGVFDFIGEVGKVRGVFSLEMDFVYGQAGANNSQLGSFASTTPAPISSANGTQCGGALNIDVRGCLKVKWLYVEFPIPLIPVPSTMTLGMQPFGTAATYKIAAYAQGEASGVKIVSEITPNVKLLASYYQIETNLAGTGTQHGKPFNPNTTTLANGTTNPSSQNRGDDAAVIVAPEITPFKGLDLKPMFSTFYAQGTTAGNARVARGGINTSTAFTNPDGTSRGGINEYRYTVGADARLRMGPFSFDPTVLYQFGTRDVFISPASPIVTNGGVTVPALGHKFKADINAWLVDFREGFQLGPLLIEALQVYSTGNTSRNTTLGNVRYFQPLDTDTAYLIDWGTQLSSLGVDYDQGFNGAGQRVAYTGVAIGWDKYGRGQLGLKATYALTPTLSLMAGANGLWTAEAVDKTSIPVSGFGSVPSWNAGGAEKKSHYIGTEFMTILSWRFTDGISFDNAFGYLIPGQALTNLLTDPTQGPRNAKDIYLLTSRIRFTF